jgi:hypothetical protein
MLTDNSEDEVKDESDGYDNRQSTTTKKGNHDPFVTGK